MDRDGGPKVGVPAGWSDPFHVEYAVRVGLCPAMGFRHASGSFPNRCQQRLTRKNREFSTSTASFPNQLPRIAPATAGERPELLARCRTLGRIIICFDNRLECCIENTGFSVKRFVFVRVPPLHENIPASGQGVPHARIYRGQSAHRTFNFGHLPLEPLLGIFPQPIEQLQQVMSLVRRPVTFSALPGLQRDLCPEGQKYRPNQYDSFQKRIVPGSPLVPAFVDLFRNSSQRFRSANHQFWMPHLLVLHVTSHLRSV